MVMSFVPLFILVSIFVFVLYYSFPAIQYMGIRFFTTYLWYPGIESRPPVHVNGVTAPYASSYGLILFLTGTLVSSALAIIIALPLSFFSSIAVELYLPSRMKKVLISIIELFAGIPSVVYGLWGIIVLEPVLFYNIEPWMKENLSSVPGFAGEIYSGAGILASAIILAIMITPIIVSVMVNSFDTVPVEIKQGIISLGATKWELGKYLITGYSRMSTYGGTLLGLGRALGETMAVLMVSGAVVNVLPSSFYSAINTMAAAVASLLDSAFFDSTGMSIAALSELSLVLMIISLTVNVLGRRIAGRSALRGEELD